MKDGTKTEEIHENMMYPLQFVYHQLLQQCVAYSFLNNLFVARDLMIQFSAKTMLSMNAKCLPKKTVVMSIANCDQY